MAYADSTFYKNTYGGSLIPDAELDSYLQKASDNIDTITYFNINKLGGFDSLSAFRQEKVQYAVCEQADTDYTYKDLPEGVDSYSIGDVSVKLEINSITGVIQSRGAISYLLPTSLLNRRL